MAPPAPGARRSWSNVEVAMSVAAVAEPAVAVGAVFGAAWPLARRGGRPRCESGERVVLTARVEPGEPAAGSKGRIYLPLDDRRVVVVFDDGTGGVFPVARLRRTR
jgi:hypothetical protein